MDIALRLEGSSEKLVALFLAFFLSLRKKFPQLQRRKFTSKSHVCENAKVFREMYICLFPSYDLLTSTKIYLGLACSAQGNYNFYLNYSNGMLKKNESVS